MATRELRTVGSRRALRPVHLAAILLGILGMHAFAQHCPTPSHMMTATGSLMGATASASTGGADVHADHQGAAIPAQPAAVVAQAFVAHPDPDGSVGDMTMLCAAMLLGAGALLTMLLRRRPILTVLLSHPPGRRSRRPVRAWARAGPPPCFAFSVIRC